MRIVVWCLTLLLLLSPAHAQVNYELNSIRTTVENAAKRLQAGQLPNARHFVDSAKASIAKANAKTQADPELEKLKTKLAAIETELAKKEAGAQSTTGADEKLRDAARAAQTAKIHLQGDEFAKAQAEFKKCMQLVTEGIAIDASVRTRQADGGSLTGADLEKLCKDGATKPATKARAADTDEGKAAVKHFAAAVKVLDDKKKLKAEELVAAMKEAEDCDRQLGPLRGLAMRNGDRYYDSATEKLSTVKGELTMDELGKQCAEIVIALKKRKATGCGVKAAGLSQTRKSHKGPWGAIEKTTADGAFRYVACDQMPKKSSFPGKAASFRKDIELACGKKGVYVILHADWFNETPERRHMLGECYLKGDLYFIPTPRD